VGVTCCAWSNGGCEPPRPAYDRLGVIARRSAILLSGTAAIALSIAQPASAISINDPVAAAAGGIANYYDSTNQWGCPAFLLNIEKRSLPRLMLSGDGLASNDAV